ncbi:MAG: cadmium-translocating P-type ATPase [Clostridia bacterium]|nr:cadmium-translocating P-type ATPase [Clostridia bacterium]
MKKRWIIWTAGAVLYASGWAVHLLTEKSWITTVVFGAAWLIVGWKVAWKALRNIARGQVFDENFLMMIASAGAFVIGEAAEGAAVMLFYQLGEIFESMAVARSRRSVTELMSIRPDTATVLRDGTPVTVEPEEVAVGETILVAAGEKVPLDGVVLSGASSLDTAALTGESLPREVAEGDTVNSGCVNGSGLLTIRVTGTYGESTVAKILDMVENAAAKKSRSESFITRFAAVYTPVVVGLALVLAILPPLLIPGASFVDWIYRALNFLVISCPCALVISVPLSFFGGIGGASRNGILVKGSGSLEALASARIAVFDKTGTLTEGTFQVSRIVPANGFTEEELLSYAARAEAWSTHPIARSLETAYGKPVSAETVTDVQEEAGGGICAVVNGHTVLAGNRRLMEGHGIVFAPAMLQPGESPVYAAVDGVYAGWIAISDRIKSDAAAAVAGLRAYGFRKTVMLTGDRTDTGEMVGRMLGVEETRCELLPGDKVAAVEELLAQKRPGETLVFMGDGINDAPVLARADIGAAMGGLGSDAAMEAADIVIMNDAPSRLVTAVQIARKTMRIVRQNIVFAIGVKILVMLLSAIGYANMWMAVFADVGVSVLAIANALRCLGRKQNN